MIRIRTRMSEEFTFLGYIVSSQRYASLLGEQGKANEIVCFPV